MPSEPSVQNNHRKKIAGAGIIFGAAIGWGIGTIIGNIGGGTATGICLGLGITWLISRKKAAN